MTGISICQALDLVLAQTGAKFVRVAQKTRESRTGGNIGSTILIFEQDRRQQGVYKVLASLFTHILAFWGKKRNEI